MQTSQVFDAAWERCAKAIERATLIDLMLGFEERSSVDPRELGEPHPNLDPPGRFWVYESPPITRIPRFAILYEIDDDEGIVRLWSIYFLD